MVGCGYPQGKDRFRAFDFFAEEYCAMWTAGSRHQTTAYANVRMIQNRR